MVVTLDFETFYSPTYNLRKGVIAYVRDPQFHAQGVGMQIDDDAPQWYTGESIPQALRSIDWGVTLLVGHNLYFDATILFEHYGIVPARRIDTMSMARGILPQGASCSLNNVADMLGLGSKVGGVLASVVGIRDPDPGLLAKLGDYCLQDVALTRQIYLALLPLYQQSELDLIDLTLRMATQPVLEIDVAMARKACEKAVTASHEAISASRYPRSVLASNKQFGELLTSKGIALPTKTSPATGEETTAFGKGDPEFIELMLRYPDLKPLWEGRLAAKSTLPATRAGRWVEIGTTGSGLLPMPLSYYGAHTGRFSGMDGVNVQNLPRGGDLRRAIRAPRGCVVHVRDSAQIELRVNAWFNDQRDVLEALGSGIDLYKRAAAAQFRVPESEVTKSQRQFGKVTVLGGGYGMGWRRFRHFCAGGPLGMAPIYISEEEAQAAIATYRRMNAHIVQGWQTLGDCIAIMATGGSLDYKCVKFRDQCAELPNGMRLDYAGLHATEDGWVYGLGPKPKNLWGGSLDENLVQALSRIILTDQMLAVDRLDEVRVVGFTHDEIISVIPERLVEDADKEIERLMATPPGWCADMPLASDGGWDYMYSK